MKRIVCMIFGHTWVRRGTNYTGEYVEIDYQCRRCGIWRTER